MSNLLTARPWLWVTCLLIGFSLIEMWWERARAVPADSTQRVAANFTAYIASISLAAGLTMLVGAAMPGWLPFTGQSPSRGLFDLSPAIGLLAYIIGYSLIAYWLHRASHRLPLLWRVHRVHHSDPVVDATTTIRTHPFEHVAFAAVQLGIVGLTGVGATAVVGYALATTGWSIWTHAALGNKPVGYLGPLRWLASPAVHALHHSSTGRQTDSNYAAVFIGWDIIFGSYLDPRLETIERYGLGPEFDDRGSWRDQLLLPFLPSRRSASATASSGPTIG